jgi:hypothetical protein
MLLIECRLHQPKPRTILPGAFFAPGAVNFWHKWHTVLVPKTSDDAPSFGDDSLKRFVFKGFTVCRQLALRQLKLSCSKNNLTRLKI